MQLSLAFQNLPPQMRATILMVAALFMFTSMGIFIRLSAAGLPVIEVVFFRNALAMVLLLPLIMRMGRPSIRMQKPKLFFLRALINFGGMFCGFTALTLIPLAQMTALGFTGPLFVTIGAVLFLGEVIRVRRIAAIAVGFLGTLIILQPGYTEISVGAMMALASALSIAMASLIVKKLTATETPEAIVFWMVTMQAPLALIPAIGVWQWPTLETWIYLWAMALSGTIAHLCFTRAYRLVDITALQPLEFIKLPFAVCLAWIVFGEWPGLWTWVGGAVIFASTVYITQREARAKKSLRPNAGIKESKL
ncbi:MAG: DMT family transporter [Candidatus Puniceispirillum sp.]|nr:DMT family transporter [Candidatus Puniceispirillum sp.]